jgi:hypothetical protein
MSRTFEMPKTPVIGTVGQNGEVLMNEGAQRYLGGVEVLSKRVAANLSSTATTAELIAALKAAGLMMPDQ